MKWASTVPPQWSKGVLVGLSFLQLRLRTGLFPRPPPPPKALTLGLERKPPPAVCALWLGTGVDFSSLGGVGNTRSFMLDVVCIISII